MPARSNLFQKVVFLIQQQLADGATVTESAMLTDTVTGIEREVDVHIVGAVAGKRVTVSIECVDHSRKASVTWVEQQYQKHQHLATNALVLISSSGFYSSAQLFADAHGVTLLTPGVAEESAARKVVGQLGAVWYKEVALTLQRTEVDVVHADGDIVEVIDPTLYASDGTPLDDVVAMATRLLDDEELRAQSSRDATGEETHFTMGAVPHTRPDDGSEPEHLWVKGKLNGAEQLLEVTELRAVGEAKVRVAEVPLNHGLLDGVPFSYGTGRSADREVLMVVTEKDNESPVTTIQITVPAGGSIGAPAAPELREGHGATGA